MVLIDRGRAATLGHETVDIYIGGTVVAALARFERFSEPWSGSSDEFSAGNGSVMRLPPVPLFFARYPVK